jgi:hypothetical protein
MNNKLSVIMKIRLLFLGVVLSLVALFVVVSCGGGSSVGGLNDILIGNSGGSGSGGGSANITPVPFDDLSDNAGATFIDPNDFVGDSDDTYDLADEGLYVAEDVLPFDFSLFGNNFNAPIDIVFSTNGWFSFDSDIGNDGFYADYPVDYIDDVLVGDSESGYGPYNSLIAPFWSNLVVDLQYGVGYQLVDDGSGSNRKFIVQYFASDSENEDNELVFQTILFEGTNDIQFTYAKMQDVDGDDTNGSFGAVDGSGSLIGLFVGENTSDMNISVYSAFSSSIPIENISQTQAYYVYFKYNSSRNNYDIYTGYVASDLNLNVFNPNLRANRNQNVKNKQRRSTNFRYFYRTNTIQEFMNFVNSIRGNRSHN